MVLIVINYGALLAHLRARTGLFVMLVLAAACAGNLAVFAQRFEAHPYGGDLGDMVVLFDRVKGLQAPSQAVHTVHPLLFTLRTGIAAPMTLSERGIEPTYTHLILHESGNPAAPARQFMPGATLILSQGLWRYYALPVPMTQRALTAAQR